MVRTWFTRLGKVPPPRKLTLMYLANDVVQNSKKKHPEIAKEFGTVMRKVSEHLASQGLDEKTAKSIGRLFNIWRERTIFDPKVQAAVDGAWHKKRRTSSTSVASSAAAAEKDDATAPKKPKIGQSASITRQCTLF